MPSPSSLGVSSLLSHLTMSSPLLALTPSCIPPWVETFWSHVGLPSTSRSLEPDITLQSSISSANPFLKLNTIRHDLSATSLHSRDLLRQLSKERLIVRCNPTSALPTLQKAQAATTHPCQHPKRHSSQHPAPLAPCTSRIRLAHP